jgi:hypothetical protein
VVHCRCGHHHAVRRLQGGGSKTLLRELILALSTVPVEYPPGGHSEHLSRQILAALATMETVPVAVP